MKRTPGDAARRAVLTETTAGIHRVRTVVYLSETAAAMPIEKAREACRGYADRFYWLVVAEVVDDVASSASCPLQRAGFVSAVSCLGRHQADVLLVADAATISADAEDVAIACAHVERLGAFIDIVRTK